ncbi:MAG: tRNA (adenosine(37)-N6)-threonylcarbamoyltransferase complex dimerization subunit type 1 TsaB [Peptococcaceae bacterium]|nr:tRNA (adenosine(37)-N6)-threonylcarbamoyltransferase complex dimerization subunit type 1 TsaB [Peptococcaceae bacterium]
MYVLGIESATPVAGVAVAQGGRILAERMINNRKTHSGHLLNMIKAVIEEAGVRPGDIGGIAVSSGPGSFTGLRIGMSTAKTLAQVWRVPVVGVSTLEALVHPLTGLANLVCPVLNARKNEVYTAVYDVADGTINDMTGPRALKPEDLAALLAKWPDRAVTFLGDGVDEYRERFMVLLGKRAVFAPGAASLPRGASVADFGRIKLEKGEGVDPLVLLPNYVRLSEAEVKWQQKQQTTGKDSACSSQ